MMKCGLNYHGYFFERLEISRKDPRNLIGHSVDLQLAAVVVVANIAEQLAPQIAAAVPGNVVGRESELEEYSRTIIIYTDINTYVWIA